MNFLSWLPKTFRTNKKKAKSAKLNILNILNIHIQSYQGINEDDILYKYFYTLTSPNRNRLELTRLLPYGRLHTLLPLGNQNFKWGAQTGT